MIFRVTINGRRGRALLDSGASIDFVDRRFVTNMKPKPEIFDQQAQITLGDNSKIDSGKASHLTVIMHNEALQGEFQIIDLPDTFDLILGMRFLQRHDCRVALAARTATFRAEGTGKHFVAAGLTIMQSLPPANQMRHSDLDGALFFLRQPGDAPTINNDVNQVETTTNFQTMVREAAKQEEGRRTRWSSYRPTAYLVESLEQLLPDTLPQKAKRHLERERKEAGGNLHYHKVEQPAEAAYWLHQLHHGRSNRDRSMQEARANGTRPCGGRPQLQSQSRTYQQGTVPYETAIQGTGQTPSTRTCNFFDDTAVYTSKTGKQGSRLGSGEPTQLPPKGTSFLKPQSSVHTNTEQLTAVTDKTRARYIDRPLDETKTEERDEFKKTFTEIQAQVLPESEINTPHPEHKALANQMLQNTRRWKCLRELDKAIVMDTDEPLVLEERGDAKGPPPNWSYPVPKALLPQLSAFIEELLAKSFIELVPHGRGARAWYSLVLILKKPNGKGWRFVIDLRAVNARTKPVQYYMPQIHELYDRIKHSKFLSMLDLKSAYHQAPLAEESRFKCSFKCELGAFRYKVLPMGLVSSAAYYQRFVESKLDRHGVLYRKVSATANDNDVYIDSDGMKCRGFVCIYLDDIVVFSRDAQQHRRHLERLFEVLSAENLYLAPDKCELFCKHIRYLGAIVGSGKLYMCPRKVYSVINMPLPNEGQDQIRMFLGLTGFYRRFIADYADMCRPLMDLLKDKVDVKATWTNEHTEAVRKLKHSIIMLLSCSTAIRPHETYRGRIGRKRVRHRRRTHTILRQEPMCRGLRITTTNTGRSELLGTRTGMLGNQILPKQVQTLRARHQHHGQVSIGSPIVTILDERTRNQRARRRTNRKMGERIERLQLHHRIPSWKEERGRRHLEQTNCGRKR